MYTTPILLITFNRPSHVKNALHEIRKQQPTTLYVFQDGPRVTHPDDAEKLQKVRDIIDEMVDWKCDLKLNYQTKNLGCGRGPYEAMSWFFQNVEMGIILEDDIIPHPLFFAYMENLLERYKDEQQIGMVTGHNLQRYYSRHNSYYFTHEMFGTLGWGTWRRVWKSFEFQIPYQELELRNALKSYGLSKLIINQLCKQYKKWLTGSRHDFWDYQFDYYLMINHYYNARPNSCLTSHEGDDDSATHTGFTNPRYKMEVNESRFNPINHPITVKIDSSVRFRMFKKEIHLLIKKLLHKHDTIITSE